MMTSPYYIRVATGIALWAGLALSWNVICGYAGYISFGHVAFFGIGGVDPRLPLQAAHPSDILAAPPLAAVVSAPRVSLVPCSAAPPSGARLLLLALRA